MPTDTTAAGTATDAEGDSHRSHSCPREEHAVIIATGSALLARSVWDGDTRERARPDRRRAGPRRYFFAPPTDD